MRLKTDSKLVLDALRGTYADLERNIPLTPYQWRRVRAMLTMAYIYGRLKLIMEQEAFRHETCG